MSDQEIAARAGFLILIAGAIMPMPGQKGHIASKNINTDDELHY